MKRPQWISIFDRKPESGSTVVVLFPSGGRTVAKFDGFYFTEDDLLTERISHWLPLPKTPPPEMLKMVYNYEDLQKLAGGC